MNISITLKSKPNVSLSIGDTIHSQSPLTGYGYVGVLSDIQGQTLTVNDAATQPASNDFLFFEKNTLGAPGGIKGSVAHVEMINTSQEHADLFAVNFGYAESSK